MRPTSLRRRSDPCQAAVGPGGGAREAETADLFGPQRSRQSTFWQGIRGSVPAEIAVDGLMGLSEFCRSFDVVECWFDPDADGQPNLVHLLDHIRHDPETVEKPLLVHAEAPLGGMAPAEILASDRLRIRLDSGHIDAVHRFWTAYRQPTPEAFAGLLEADLSALPRSVRLVPRLLAELPSADTGLDPTRHPRTFDRDASRTHRQRRLSLTSLGWAPLARCEDHSCHGRIDRWLGATRRWRTRACGGGARPSAG